MSINVYIDKFGTSVIGAVAEGNKLLEYHVEKLNKKRSQELEETLDKKMLSVPDCRCMGAAALV